MAIPNKVLSNPITKQNIRFLQTSKDTGGKLLEMETTYHTLSLEPPPHYHPHQEEDFTVIEGYLTVRIDGQLKVLRSGDTLHIRKNQIHSMWNNTDAKTVVNWKVRPAMDTENFLETVMGLAGDAKVNRKGIPNLLQVALIANKFAAVFRLSKPPFVVQRLLFLILLPFSYLFGYRATYGKYLD